MVTKDSNCFKNFLSDVTFTGKVVCSNNFPDFKVIDIRKQRAMCM